MLKHTYETDTNYYRCSEKGGRLGLAWPIPRRAPGEARLEGSPGESDRQAEYCW